MDELNDWAHLEPEEEFIDESEPEPDKYEQFKYEQYDWTAPGFDPDYRVIRLGGTRESNRRLSPHSGVYFTVVSKARFELPEIGDVSWYPTVEYERDKHGQQVEGQIKRIVAGHGAGGRKDYRNLLLHRVITGTEGRYNIVDHKGLGPLDNRDEALWSTNTIVNRYTAKRKRTNGLLPGVEWRSKELKTHVLGVIEIKGNKERSDEFWPLKDQHLAHAWYLARRAEVIQELGLETHWVNPTKPPPELIFPPLKRKFYTVSMPRELSGEEIPF